MSFYERQGFRVVKKYRQTDFAKTLIFLTPDHYAVLQKLHYAF
jgi:hypothetical protein